MKTNDRSRPVPRPGEIRIMRTLARPLESIWAYLNDRTKNAAVVRRRADGIARRRR